ncbi:unnamed protein product [Ceratitis capitata]|uniref:non-specific serine/threonine protein kinase n=2 Tax=Ceratitis capitata TaxID=7213 RepID=A0A811UKQ5_CERCA|nr:unnamed protein product [Ceratitis capitata]
MNIGDNSLAPLRILGEGAFGRVYLCRCVSTGAPPVVCVKRILIQQPKLEIKMLMEEIYIISQLKHPSIIKFIRSYVHESSVNIVMEFASNGTMRDIISLNRRPSISKKRFLEMIIDIIIGLEYLHIRHIIHRDLKPENILIDKNNKIKIADFGISTIFSKNKAIQGLTGTYLYMAPEVMKGEKYEFKSDVWSLGCILYEMCNGFSPFKHAKNLADLKYLIQSCAQNGLDTASISTYYGIEWGRICKKMIVVNPSKRLSLCNIVSYDPNIAIPYYCVYFNYKNDFM